MVLTFLGSGTGAPSLKRGACSILIKIANQHLLFDTGPGTIRSLLNIGLTYHDIDYLFYTHLHTDHTLDLATLLFAAKYALSLRTKKLIAVGPQGLGGFYQGLLNLYEEVIRPEDYELELREIKEQNLEFSTFKMETRAMRHSPESLGYRVQAQGKVIAYSGDTDVCDNLIRLGKEADILILDCSFPDQMKASGHLIPQEAGQIARECNCKKLILTHLYPICDNYDIAQQARKKFRGEVVVAADLMSLTI